MLRVFVLLGILSLSVAAEFGGGGYHLNVSPKKGYEDKRDRYEDYLQRTGCGPCDRSNCPLVHSSDCLAGVVLDSCGCCEECAKAEFEICEHPDAPSHTGIPRGKCGDQLECKMREDLDASDRPEAVCVCMNQEQMCGTDDVTYENICQLMATAITSKQSITVRNKGPCQRAPQIVSKPDNMKDREGSNVALVCEASGYPIPTVEWTWTRVDGKTVFLPSDDLKISVNMRGGPEKWQVTGWLQVMDIGKQHEGDYTCIAQNDNGVVQATARINVIADESKPKKSYKFQEF